MWDEETFTRIRERIEKYEGICDNMEFEIATYLNQLADGRLSDQTKREVHKMLRIVSELESVGANYMDIVRELERMADYIINVVEALYAHKHDKKS